MFKLTEWHCWRCSSITETCLWDCAISVSRFTAYFRQQETDSIARTTTTNCSHAVSGCFRYQHSNV